MLASLLSAEQILPEVAAEEQWQAIEEMVNRLVLAKKFAPHHRDEILNALWNREKTMSTGIGYGIAIPHASSEHVQEVVAAFGRSKKGIEFDALDNEPVHFIVLFVVPRDQFQVHLRTLASIAKFLNDKTVRFDLAQASTPEQMLSVLNNRPKRMPLAPHLVTHAS